MFVSEQYLREINPNLVRDIGLVLGAGSTGYLMKREFDKTKKELMKQKRLKELERNKKLKGR